MQTKELRSSVTFPARADYKSTGCMKFTLDGCSSSARACIPSLDRTVSTCKVLDARISHSSSTYLARVDCMNTRLTLERRTLRSSVSPKSRISRFEPQAQNSTLNHQIRSFWANFLENTCKLIIWHVSKINLRNQSPKVVQLNTNFKELLWTRLKCNMHELKWI